MSKPGIHTEFPLLADMQAYLDRAEAAVAARDMVALGALDAEVDRLCHVLGDVGPEAARPHAARLAALMERLAGLQGSMVGLQQEIAAEIATVGTTRKANRAYQKTTGEG